MTEEEQQALSNSIDVILRFYVNARDGRVVTSPTHGGFVERFISKYPDLYEGHEDFLWAIDNMIMLLHERGERQ